MPTLKTQQDYSRKWYAENKEKRKEYSKKYYLQNKEKFYSHNKIQHEKERIFNIEFKRKNGISWRSIINNGLEALEAVKRADKKCEICHKTKNNLTIHHKDNKGWNYYRRGLTPNNTLDNLLVVCNNCHTRLHMKK